MRSKTLLLAIAGICGTVAAVGASKLIQGKGTSEVLATAEIFVTTQDVEIGQQFSAENIKLEPWPLDRMPEGAIRDLEQVEGMYSNQRLYAGEPLIARKVNSTPGNTRRDIPRDYNVVSLQCDPATGVGTLVEPGDRVNIMGFFKKSDVIPQTMTQKVLTGIRVYAVDGRKTRTEGDAVGTPAAHDLAADSQKGRRSLDLCQRAGPRATLAQSPRRIRGQLRIRGRGRFGAGISEVDRRQRQGRGQPTDCREVAARSAARGGQLHGDHGRNFRGAGAGRGRAPADAEDFRWRDLCLRTAQRTLGRRAVQRSRQCQRCSQRRACGLQRRSLQLPEQFAKPLFR